MNKLIEKLAEQALVEEMDLTWGKKSVFSKEKFAELIVKECVDICRLQGDKLKYERKMQAMLDARLIKEHFGVE